jgi:DNA primase
MVGNGWLDPGLLSEIRRRTSLAELIGGTGPQQVKLKRAGRELRGLCPFHTERTPSFYVVEDKGFWHCFGCGSSGDCIAWVIKMTDLKFHDAALWLAARAGIAAEGGLTPQARPIVRRPGAEMIEARERVRIAEARAIWHSRQAPQGTLAERYWRGRRLWLPMPPTIGFVERLPHPFLRDALPYPALIAAIQAPDDGGRKRVLGVHCIYLPRPGELGDEKGRALPPPSWPGDRKWKSKLTRGIAHSGAVRLTAAEDLMVVGEGIETSASLLQGLHDPEIGAPHVDGEPVGVWAALSQSNLGTIWLPEHVREVILAGDGDGKIPDADDARQDPDAILDAAGARHADQGRVVRLAKPPVGSDFNDLLPPGEQCRPR